MRRVRVIPVLLVKNGGLVKSVQFKNHRYVGDPINAVKIFNEKEVDEIIILDISATKENRLPDFNRIAEIAGEAFMPLAYGGGITTIDEIKRILYEGAEKVILNTSAIFNPELIREGAIQFGSQSIVISIDVKKNLWGKYQIFSHNGTKNTGLDPVAFSKKAVDFGAGELFINSIDRDGTYKGYDLEILKKITSAVDVPVIACGGASEINDFAGAIKTGGASAVAAGSIFVFQRPHQAVLISYPSQEELKKEVFSL